MTPTLLPVELLRLDGHTQPRAHLHQKLIEDYTASRKAGAQFPPITVFLDGQHYWVADGFHRVKSADGRILCDVRRGTKKEAQWYSYGVNQTHGERRSNEDKTRAVEAALKHPLGAGRSDSFIAKHVGVDPNTVAKRRAELENTSEIPKSTTRCGSDGRTMRIGNIGSKTKGQAPRARDFPEGHRPSPADTTKSPSACTPADPASKQCFAEFMAYVRKARECKNSVEQNAAELILMDGLDYDNCLWGLDASIQQILTRAGRLRDAAGKPAPTSAAVEWERARHTQLENSTVGDKLNAVFSHMQDLSSRLLHLDQSVVRDQYSAEEIAAWAAKARDSADQLGVFAAALSEPDQFRPGHAA